MDALLSSLKGNPKLQRAFMNAFMGTELPNSLKVLSSSDEIKRTLGPGTLKKALALCKT
jgi:hypothetical protein